MSEKFRQEFSRIVTGQVENHTATNALLHVVLPLSIAVLGVSTPYLWSLNPIVPIMIWSLVLVVYLLSWWKSHPTYTDVHRLLLQKQIDDSEIEALEVELDEFKEVVEDLYFKNMAAFAYRAMSVEYISGIDKNGLDENYFHELLNELLSPFYLQGDSIFDFFISEKWSIGVYIYDNKDATLKSVWREKSNSHPSQGLGRDWKPGEGHVGKAFLDRRPILTGNANDEDVYQLCRSRGSKRTEYDDTTYVSFASVPISVSENDDYDPFGVLVVTSNCKGRFSEESITELLMHAAQTIAVILELSNADIGCLINPNHDMNSPIKGESNVGSAQKA